LPATFDERAGVGARRLHARVTFITNGESVTINTIAVRTSRPARFVVFPRLRSLIVPTAPYTTSSWCHINFLARLQTSEQESLFSGRSSSSGIKSPLNWDSGLKKGFPAGFRSRFRRVKAFRDFGWADGKVCSAAFVRTRLKARAESLLTGPSHLPEASLGRNKHADSR
jgi:hypothetical protein